MNDKASRTSDLVNGTQQKIQLELNFAAVTTGNAPRTYSAHRNGPTRAHVNGASLWLDIGRAVR